MCATTGAIPVVTLGIRKKRTRKTRIIEVDEISLLMANAFRIAFKRRYYKPIKRRENDTVII